MRIGYGLATVVVLRAMIAAGPALAAPEGDARAKTAPDVQAAALKAETEESRKVLEGFLGLMGQGKYEEAIQRYSTENYIQHHPGIAPGREGAREHFKREIAQGARVTLKGMTVEGNMAAIHLHREFADGSPPEEVIEMWRIENGRLAEHWGVAEQLAPHGHDHSAK